MPQVSDSTGHFFGLSHYRWYGQLIEDFSSVTTCKDVEEGVDVKDNDDNDGGDGQDGDERDVKNVDKSDV